jgi:hypothetical protein
MGEMMRERRISEIAWQSDRDCVRRGCQVVGPTEAIFAERNAPRANRARGPLD